MNTQAARPEDVAIEQLRALDASIAAALEERDGPARLASEFSTKFSFGDVAVPGRAQQIWELAGLYCKHRGRFHEALALFWGLYQHMVEAQKELGRLHKGMPLVWMSDCYRLLDYPVHAKRYLMLTIVEDALREQGTISPATTGTYFRAVWDYGLPDADLRRYASRFFELTKELPEDAGYPEALLQRVDDSWLTELPSPREALVYRLSPLYVRHLLSRLGGSRGEALEQLAEYLMSCMPGCRTKRRQRSLSTDYDLVCAMEGFNVDFRSEFGRYFVCECKDWERPADFTTMAKFCRVLDSTKARFGILFSKHGLSGAGRSTDAEREQLKVFQDRAIVIVVLSSDDLEAVASGANLVQLLRQRYERVRLDLAGSRDAG